MGNIIDTLSKYPWLIGIGAATGLFLLMRGGSSAVPSSGADYSATLASQKIATDAAVALSGVQVQAEAVRAQQNIATVQARRDIILGAQNLALADKSLTTDLAVTSMNNTRLMADSSAKTATDFFTVATGFALNNRDLDNQADALEKGFNLSMSGIMSDRITKSMELTYMDDASKRGNTLTFDLANLNSIVTRALDASYYENVTNVTENQLKLDREANNAEFRINEQNQATIQNLAWRQKQIAKQGGMFNLFNNLIGTAGSLASAAIMR